MDVNEALELANGSALPWAPVLAAEVRRLREENAEMGRAWVAEVDELRARVTTGGPAPHFTDQWENGASSRPPTAPPEPKVVQLPNGDQLVGPYGEWCSEHGEEMQDHDCT